MIFFNLFSSGMTISIFPHNDLGTYFYQIHFKKNAISWWEIGDYCFEKKILKCWYHTQKITWHLLFVLRTQHIHTGLCSFGCALLLASPHFCISTHFSNPCFKFYPAGLQKKMLVIAECPALSDQSLCQTHVKLSLSNNLCYIMLFCKIHTNKADW